MIEEPRPNIGAGVSGVTRNIDAEVIRYASSVDGYRLDKDGNPLRGDLPGAIIRAFSGALNKFRSVSYQKDNTNLANAYYDMAVRRLIIGKLRGKNFNKQTLIDILTASQTSLNMSTLGDKGKFLDWANTSVNEHIYGEKKIGGGILGGLRK